MPVRDIILIFNYFNFYASRYYFIVWDIFLKIVNL